MLNEGRASNCSRVAAVGTLYPRLLRSSSSYSSSLGVAELSAVYSTCKRLHSGVETEGSGGSMNWGPELRGAPGSGAKKF